MFIFFFKKALANEIQNLFLPKFFEQALINKHKLLYVG